MRTTFAAAGLALALVNPVFHPAAAQTAGGAVRPLLGTVVAKVPTAFVGGEYWIYVNRQIVNAPPHAAGVAKSAAFVNISLDMNQEGTGGFDLFDKDGQAARSRGGQIIFVRAGVEENIFDEFRIQLAPGAYSVELLARSGSWDFPFVTVKRDIDVQAGAPASVTFGVPRGYAQRLIAVATPVYGFMVPPGELLKRIYGDLTAYAAGFEKDPRVPPLNEALTNVMLSPPLRPAILVGMPEELGGRREFDAAQIDILVDGLVHKYFFPPFDAGPLRSAQAPIPQQYAQLEYQISAHNKRISQLRDIAKRLREAKSY